jgi:hypothetical protein
MSSDWNMHIATQPVSCLKCGEEWMAQVVQSAPVELVTASWKVLRCPACGAKWNKLAFIEKLTKAKET